MNVNIFAVKNGKIELKARKLTVRIYDSVEKTTYQDRELYLDNEEYNEWTTQLIPKHQLYELLSDEEISDEYAWMNGIEVSGRDRAREIAEIASYGSREVYNASLAEYRDEYLLELECRVSMIELGV